MVCQDGTIRWVTARGRFYYTKSGTSERMLGMAVDIAERKQTEEALKKSEEKFAKAFRQSPMAVTLTSTMDHRYLDVNETFERVTGWRRDELIGRTPFDIRIWVDPAQREEYVKQTLAQGGTRNWQVRFRCKDGEQRVGLGSGEIIEIDGERCLLMRSNGSCCSTLPQKKCLAAPQVKPWERLSNVSFHHASAPSTAHIFAATARVGSRTAQWAPWARCGPCEPMGQNSPSRPRSPKSKPTGANSLQ
ncbi:MAG: hypothetical protein DMG45_18430 [Acidobacteria bacterium]|nr:MAG: hypothetical protein DMG45_18430 [Acidobacteriota bacterium]